MRIFFLMLIMLFTVSSCNKKTVRFTSHRIIIPESVSLSVKEVSAHLGLPVSDIRNNSIEIIIYHYTSGIEQIKYTENIGFTTKIKDGKLNALIKFRINNTLDSVRFIRVSAEGKEALLNALKKECGIIISSLYN